jgi:hypothetical protein
LTVGKEKNRGAHGNALRDVSLFSVSCYGK